MVASRDEQGTRDRFRRAISCARVHGVIDELEREVIGEAWAANGFTTVEEAEEQRRRLDLRTGSRLLDLGSGCGWPGLFLARESGCEVAVTDLPTQGLEVAIRRAEAEGLKTLGAVASSARQLPFAESSFDAIVHTVIC